MPSKQPLYTALGFVTWTVGKRVIKRKVTGGTKRGRRVVIVGVAIRCFRETRDAGARGRRANAAGRYLVRVARVPHEAPAAHAAWGKRKEAAFEEAQQGPCAREAEDAFDVGAMAMFEIEPVGASQCVEALALRLVSKKQIDVVEQRGVDVRHPGKIPVR